LLRIVAGRDRVLRTTLAQRHVDIIAGTRAKIRSMNWTPGAEPAPQKPAGELRGWNVR